MRIAYLDAANGASGDMFLGALVDAGCPLETIEAGLRTLPRDGFSLQSTSVRRGSSRCTKVDVLMPGGTGRPMRLGEIEGIVREGRLSDRVRASALAVFARRADAESRLSGVDPRDIPCHDLDALVDVVGTTIGLEALGLAKAHASPIRLGPASHPASLELSKGWPVLAGGPGVELTTPTGAALVTTLASPAEPPSPLTLDVVGYGAGSWEIDSWPNYFRLWIGRTSPWETDQVWELSTNLDNFNPEGTEHLLDRLFAAGALDVFLTPVQMKKTRPGTLVTILAEPTRLEALQRVLFEETPTLGIRRTLSLREKLPRRWETVATRFGPVRIKIGRIDETLEKASPEFEDLRTLARSHNVPLEAVREEALRAFDLGKGRTP